MKPSSSIKPSAAEVAALMSKTGPLTRDEIDRINEFFKAPPETETMTKEERERALVEWLDQKP
jgi:hypothetical protein